MASALFASSTAALVAAGRQRQVRTSKMLQAGTMRFCLNMVKNSNFNLISFPPDIDKRFKRETQVRS
jgi:hypothetical protein